jgi:hypothetical protein
VFLDDNLVSWSSKHQNVVCHSSDEVEYRTMANDVVEVSWLRQLLVELHNPLSWATLVYCDNVSTVCLSTNLVQHPCTEHIEIDLHFIHERIAVGDVHVLHVSTTSQSPTSSPRAALIGVLRVSVQAKYLQLLEFQLQGC